jgi:hypothetical protein
MDSSVTVVSRGFSRLSVETMSPGTSVITTVETAIVESGGGNVGIAPQAESKIALKTPKISIDLDFISFYSLK